MNLVELFRDSKELRRIIVKASYDYDMPLRYVCKEVNIDYKGFMRGYINSETDKTGYVISEEKILQILDFFNIQVRFQIVIKKDVSLQEKFKVIKNKYDEIMEKGREIERDPSYIEARLKRNKK